MLNPAAYVIRSATVEDASALTHLAVLDAQRPIYGPALIGELDGVPAAAIALDTGRIVANPFKPTAALAVHLRARRAGIDAADRRPVLRDRIRSGIRIAATPAP